MSAGRLSRRDRRVLLAGALVLLPPLLFIFVVRPVADGYGELTDRLAGERALLARERALLAEAERLPTLAGRAETALLDAAPRLFDGEDPTAATAALADYLGRRAVESRVFIQRSDGLEPTTENDITRLRVELRAATDLEGLIRLLHALESGEKLVRVGRLAVRREPFAAGADGDDVETLAVAMTIQAFALADAPDEAEASPAAGRAADDDDALSVSGRPRVESDGAPAPTTNDIPAVSPAEGGRR